MGDSSLNICMFSNLYYPIVSGSSTQSRYLARELVRRGHRVTFITARVQKDTPEHEIADGVEVYRIPATLMPKIPLAFNFPWLSYTFTRGNLHLLETIIRRCRPDVLHLHNHMFDLAFSAVRMGKRFNLPLVITFHTVIKHSNPLYNMILYPGDRVFLRHTVVKKAQRLICPDMNMQDYVHRAHNGVPTAMIPYGINLLEAPPQQKVEELRGRYGLGGKRVILSLGHVHEVRNRRDEIKALPTIRQAIPNAVLLIVGAEMSDTARRLARQVGVEDAVIFTGPRPYDEVPAYLALADIEGHLFYQDAQDETSLGIATLEAMGAGKAVFVAANVNSHGAGVLRAGENLILVAAGKPRELAQSIIDLLRDESKRQRVGQAAHKLVEEHFSWEGVCQKTLNVYQDARSRFGARGK